MISLEGQVWRGAGLEGTPALEGGRYGGKSGGRGGRSGGNSVVRGKMGGRRVI